MGFRAGAFGLLHRVFRGVFRQLGLDRGGKVESATCHGDGPPYLVMIDTLEGRMAAGRDDFVIRGVQGEFYPCKPDIFAATYEEET